MSLAPLRRAYGRLLYRTAVTLRGEGSVYARLAQLERLQFESAEHIVGKQREALARVLGHKLSRVPYYAPWRSLTSGVSPENVLERLRQLPVIEKDALQANSRQLMVAGWRGRFRSKTTGGSTGRPVTVTKNAEAIAQEMAATWLGYGWFGVGIGDPCIRFWGRPTGNLHRRLRYLAADAATNRITLSAFGYTSASLDSYVHKLERFRPRYLYGYVSVLEDLARHLMATDREGRNLGLKAVITTSEVLSAPQRALIATAFHAPVQNEYGCGEVGPIAYECPQGSLHLLPTNHLVELVDERGEPVQPGEPGSVLITDLNNDVMPLTRYRIGDTASFGQNACPCGRTFPVLEDVFGREYDFVESRSGQRYHGEFFMYLFEDLRNRSLPIGQFKVIQVDRDELTVQLTLPSNDLSRAEHLVTAEFARRLPDFKVRIERVDAIGRQPSGKMRVVENRIRSRP